LIGPRDSLSFSFAGPSDEADLRRLLRENPIRGVISVNFTREPDYSAGTQIAGGCDRTLIARENGRLIAAGRCVIRPCWLNGVIRSCAYLGELRLDASVQGRWDILRRGYAAFAADYARQPADFCFTSIVADNLRARKLFERGLPQLPRYELIGKYVTLVIPVCHRRPACAFESVTGNDVSLVELVCFLNDIARTRHLATHWTPKLLTSLSSHGLRLQDFIVLKYKSSIIGCAGIWDQRTFRQVRIHGYATWLAASRPLLNLVAPWLGQPHLPAAGTDLDQAFLSPLAFAPERISALSALLDAGRHAAAQRGLRCITAGYAEDESAFTREWDKFRGRRYTSRLYQVVWPGQKGVASRLDARPCLPDIALL